MNVILRPVFNRPEMFFLSLEYEKLAREYYKFSSDLLTIFVIEHGSDAKTKELVRSYPYNKEIIKREKQFGLSKNILEGMKSAFNLSDNFIIYIEDDILLHKTYFQYMDVLLNMFSEKEYTIFSASSADNSEKNVNALYKGHHYTALAPLITKSFFNRYLEVCVDPVYYKDTSSRNKFINALNYKYKKYVGKGYKFVNDKYNEQAGLINRLVDVAFIEEDKCIITPYVSRQLHIGYYGKNRPGGKIPGKNFDEKLVSLREIIKDPVKMYQLSTTKQYNDYLTWSPELETWDGTLYI